MQNVSEQLKTKIRKNSSEDLKGTTMKKNQTPKPTGETGPQEKIPPGWRMSFTT